MDCPDKELCTDYKHFTSWYVKSALPESSQKMLYIK